MNLLEYATIIILYAAATKKILPTNYKFNNLTLALKYFRTIFRLCPGQKKRQFPLPLVKLYVGCFQPIFLIID